MIKINYHMKPNKLEFLYAKTLLSTKFGNGENAKSIKTKFNELKQEYPYNAIFYDLTFQEIIFIKPENIQCLINKIELRIIEQSEINFKTIKNQKKFTYKAKEDLKNIFRYEKKFQEFIAKFFEENLKIKTCYFCNIHFINEYKINDTEHKNEFTLDHYFDKATYPYLALSLYNLIPSCYTCNTKLKKNEEFNNLSPSSIQFNFHQKVKFKLFLSDLCKNLHIENKKDITIPLKENYSDEYNKYIVVFKLNERYEVHKDIVFEMIEKAELYPESRLKELQDLTGIPLQQIKKDIFNLIDEDDDLSEKPFSKLIVDISNELGLL